MSKLEQRFAVAAETARKLPPPGRAKLLELYSLYKQSHEGDALQQRPGLTNLRGRTKHDAWAALQGMARETAMQRYIALVAELQAAPVDSDFADRHSTARELLERPLNSTEYEVIRKLWKAHSLAEDDRDIDGLLATLTPDCRYELPQLDRTFEGHAGATEFYERLLGAFPDIDFRLTSIVIGPQGVVEEARVTGTHEQDWLGFQATNEEVEFQVVIFFPWDPEEQLFCGERVWLSFGREYYDGYGIV
ncbi:MAG: acyl-CoA-binding protein [Candidatus Poseidoniia archaeon]|jgi:acyl-CoA-binding protein/predicted ester cyclase|nr:acyl-CoA-binding protein [Candidatus Poseidoniia archaeon]MDP6534561.1 acyl-CoA-binding protein [Candidatus Poseidoniia archaeon]MDP6834697.1 acyl-CoA-binding protein [Candidatus Poseidoniia archaeon]HIH78684.1 SnoaL-like domain-containing protein [Candidatus Poseidoniia archaeon]|tara:strand:+ start:459 stop:1202 length:744 start_codon:yes stop_codon:yes gene_type:complete